MAAGACIVVPAFLLVSANRADRGLLGFGAVFFLLLVIAVGRTLFTVGLDSAKVATVRQADNVLQQDDRPPIVYLRSFSLDDLEINRPSSITNKFFGHTNRLEEILSAILKQYGPAIALGDPNDKSPIPGFARKWVPHDAWKETILSLISRAQLVVMMLGPVHFENTELTGLGWEFVTIFTKIRPERIILVIPPAKDFGRYWGQYCELSGGKLSSKFNKYTRFVTFSADWTQQNFSHLSDEENVLISLFVKVLKTKVSLLYEKRLVFATKRPLFLPNGQARTPLLLQDKIREIKQNLRQEETQTLQNILKKRDKEEYTEVEIPHIEKMSRLFSMLVVT